MHWRRRKSLVNMTQQIGYAMELVIVGVAFVVLCAFLLFVPPFTDLFGGGELAAKVFDSLIQLIALDWPMILIALAVFGLVGILLGHRLSGPLYQLERVLETWMKGNRRVRVHFRKYDYLLPVQGTLNEFFNHQQSMLEDVEKRAREIGESLKDGRSEQAAEQIRGLISVAQELGEEASLRRALGHIQISETVRQV